MFREDARDDYSFAALKSKIPQVRFQQPIILFSFIGGNA